LARILIQIKVLAEVARIENAATRSEQTLRLKSVICVTRGSVKKVWCKRKINAIVIC
jgi:hypothetical protein